MRQVGYRDLKVYILAKVLAVEIHQMTRILLKHEMFETGSLNNKEKYLRLHKESHKLAKMLNKFLGSIKTNHMRDK